MRQTYLSAASSYVANVAPRRTRPTARIVRRMFCFAVETELYVATRRPSRLP